MEERRWLSARSSSWSHFRYGISLYFSRLREEEEEGASILGDSAAPLEAAADRLGKTCRLAERPWLFVVGLRPDVGVPVEPPAPRLSLSPPASLPKEMIDTDLLCLCPGVVEPLCPAFHAPGEVRPLPALTGTLSDKVGRCPRPVGGICVRGLCRGRLHDPRLLCVDICRGAVFRCRSPPGANPLDLEGCDECLEMVPGAGAMFLKVILHWTSSPAKTV